MDTIILAPPNILQQSSIILQEHWIQKDRKKQKINQPLLAVQSIQKIGQFQIEIFDISINGRGDKEDLFYGENVEYYHAIRRGLSFGREFKEGNQKMVILKKGLKKFFDFDIDWLQILERGENLSFKQLQEQQMGEHRQYEEQIMSYTLCEIFECLQKGDKIEIYKTEKANGENGQIRFLQKLDCWLIGSKNVTILVQNEEQLVNFEEQRYNYARLIAKEWFKHLNKHKDILEQIKQTMSHHTFIAEYLGNAEYQHLVTYQQIALRFYAAVPKANNSNLTCIPLQQAFQMFHLIQVDTVQFQTFQAHNLSQFIQIIQDIFKQVSSSSIEQEGEGSVLYMETPSNTILCKVKNLEYRIFRKIREKVKLFIDSKLNKNDFMNEVKDLCKKFSAFREIDYYNQLFDKIISVIQKEKPYFVQRKEQIINHFSDFLQIMRKSMGNENESQMTLMEEIKIKIS